MACRVLIADDTPDIRMLLRWSLDPDDRFDVVAEASNGQEAVDAARSAQIDVVLLDLAMPVMDGLQAIPIIKESSPATKIVVLSGFDAEAMGDEAMARGADAYLEKGAGFKQIAQVLLDICAA